MTKKVIALTNHKGGVGKSATSINLAADLALLNQKVLLIDADPQGATTRGLGFNEWEVKKQVLDVMLGRCNLIDVAVPTCVTGLDVAPCNLDLSGAETEVSRQEVAGREFILRDRIAEAKEYDYVIIDTSPCLGFLVVNSIIAATDLIIPMQCEFYALNGITQLVKIIDMAGLALERVAHAKRPKVRVLLTMYDARANLHKTVVEKIRTDYGKAVFDTMIPRSIKIAESPVTGKPIALYDPGSPGDIAYKKLAEEVLNDQ
jgi:chromosome partitioning protein